MKNESNSSNSQSASSPSNLNVPTEKRFRGQCRLVKLLLWKKAESTDLEYCLKSACNAGLITEKDAEFIRECANALDEVEAGKIPELATDSEVADILQRLVNKLNAADAA